jgi:hypothetical protein
VSYNAENYLSPACVTSIGMFSLHLEQLMWRTITLLPWFAQGLPLQRLRFADNRPRR